MRYRCTAGNSNTCSAFSAIPTGPIIQGRVYHNAAIAILLTYSVSFGPSSVYAQPSMSSIAGHITDEGQRPVEQALVGLASDTSLKQARTDVNGRFRFIALLPGTHRIRITRIGFQPWDTSVVVEKEEELSIRVQLKRVVALPEVAVKARGAGVWGTVLSSDSLHPISGARIELFGSRQRAETNELGEFALDGVKPGTYMLRVSRDGYNTRILSVVLSHDAFRAIDVVLAQGSTALDRHYEMRWGDMAQRINWAGVNAAIVGHEELGRDATLEGAIRFAPSFVKKGIVIDDRACIFVDGIPRPFATINDFRVEDVESVEVYGRRGEVTGTLRWPSPKAPCGNPAGYLATGKRAQFVVVWTRR